jgi:hypothetical protein
VKLKEILEEVTDMTTTSKNHGHYHFAIINDNGDGSTTTTSNGSKHKHEIKNWKVLKTEGHIHEVKKSTRR